MIPLPHLGTEAPVLLWAKLYQDSYRGGYRLRDEPLAFRLHKPLDRWYLSLNGVEIPMEPAQSLEDGQVFLRGATGWLTVLAKWIGGRTPVHLYVAPKIPWKWEPSDQEFPH